MGWIGYVRCEKIQNDFMAQTCALIAPVQPVLQRLSSRNEILPNAPKHNETHQNMSLESNGGGSGAFVAKNSNANSWHKFCTSSVRFAPRLVRQPNGPKCSKMVQNSPKHEFRVQWGGLVRSLRKIPKRLPGTNLCINCTSSTCFVMSFV